MCDRGWWVQEFSTRVLIDQNHNFQLPESCPSWALKICNCLSMETCNNSVWPRKATSKTRHLPRNLSFPHKGKWRLQLPTSFRCVVLCRSVKAMGPIWPSGWETAKPESSKRVSRCTIWTIRAKTTAKHCWKIRVTSHYAVRRANPREKESNCITTLWASRKRSKGPRCLKPLFSVPNKKKKRVIIGKAMWDPPTSPRNRSK